MKRRRLVFSLVTLGLLGFWAVPKLELARGRAVRSSCQSNLKQVGNAILQYVRDYDERYPPPQKWRMVLQPYVFGFGGERKIERLDLLDCPLETTGYAYNFFLKGTQYGKILSAAEKIPMIFDSTDLSAQTYQVKTGSKDEFRGIKWTYREFAPQKIDYGGSYPKDFRHPDGNNVLFVDGHVKFLNRKPNFAIK